MNTGKSETAGRSGLYEFETKGALEPWVDREWILTDGTGSFAMGTIAGVATRKYHSMLNAALMPPVGRVNTVNRIGEILLIDGQEAMHELSACRFAGGNIHPQGFKHLKKFCQNEDRAEWEYEVNGIRVTKTVWMPGNSGTTKVAYHVFVEGGRQVELLLLPMVALRDFHSTRQYAGWDMGVQATETSVRVDADGMAVRVDGQGLKFERDPDWWKNHQYSIETERGQGDTEDLFKPGVFRAVMRTPTTVTLTISPDPMPRVIGSAFEKGKLAGKSSAPSLAMRRLLSASDVFLARRKTPGGEAGTTVMAGFPWFADWGRDTFISLPGLLLTTGRVSEAEKVLTVFAHYVSEGMIPNKFDDYSNEPEYNTVDASLWFIHAAHEFVKAGGEKTVFEEKLLPACKEIVRGYSAGTRYGIRMEADGLIRQGDAETQLTWMDAKYNGVAFTPRQGKPVEINALWYHALKLLGEKELAEKVRGSFRARFVLPGGGGLFDTVDGDGGVNDNACRPNQIFAVSLESDLLTAEQQRSVLEVVTKELLTPYGLRSLSPKNPRYIAHYAGPQSQRDAAYHNGTVWGWLIGPFLDAYLVVHGDTPQSRESVRGMLAALLRHLEEYCVGSISEIFEAAAPHRAVGASAQAWSVAEVLRVGARVGV